MKSKNVLLKKSRSVVANILKFSLAGVLFSGCVTPPKKMTREEWLQTTTREYAGVSRDEIFAAIEKIFELSDPNDVEVVHKKNSLLISRRWYIYAVLAAASGTDNWTFDVSDSNGKLIVTTSLSTTSGTTTGYIAGSDTGTVHSSGGGNSVQGNAIYSIFWSRLDYMLGKTKVWADCKTAESDKRLHGSTDALCYVTNSNKYPSDLSDEEIERIFKGSYAGKWAYMKIHHPDKWEEQKKKDYYLP